MFSSYSFSYQSFAPRSVQRWKHGTLIASIFKSKGLITQLANLMSCALINLYHVMDDLHALSCRCSWMRRWKRLVNNQTLQAEIYWNQDGMYIYFETTLQPLDHPESPAATESPSLVRLFILSLLSITKDELKVHQSHFGKSWNYQDSAWLPKTEHPTNRGNCLRKYGRDA